MYIGGSENGVSVSEVAQCGRSLGRASLLGTLKDILGLFFWGPEDIKAVSLGAMWNFVKVKGSHASNWGTKGPSIKA
jgi:hypothetical protein